MPTRLPVAGVNEESLKRRDEFRAQVVFLLAIPAERLESFSLAEEQTI